MTLLDMALMSVAVGVAAAVIEFIWECWSEDRANRLHRQRWEQEVDAEIQRRREWIDLTDHWRSK